MEFIYKTFFDTGNAIVTTWIMVFILRGTLGALASYVTFCKNNKIQHRKFKWATLRHELMWSAVNLALTALVLTTISRWLVDGGYLMTDSSPASWYVVLFEFALFFFIFDVYFYAVHRILHWEPLYSWIHKTHHHSVAPNPLSSSSMNPVEGISEGLIIPIFLTVFTVHDVSHLFIIPFATLMGLYVHSGYDFMPSWWYKRWYSRWMQSPIFHDQHHKFFTYNYGGFTTIWDRVFKTYRKQMDQDFDRLKSKNKAASVSTNPEIA